MSIEFANGDLVVKWKFLLWLHKTSKLHDVCVVNVTHGHISKKPEE